MTEGNIPDPILPTPGSYRVEAERLLGSITTDRAFRAAALRAIGGEFYSEQTEEILEGQIAELRAAVDDPSTPLRTLEVLVMRFQSYEEGGSD